jgi:putative membrane protein
VSAGPLLGIRRPVRALLRYYVLQSIAAGPGLIVVLPLKIFRYRTLHYEFDADGMTARWGVLFRREVSLTYARIQDIHLVSNVVERWLGLARVEIQTASGQAGAEMTIEGLPDCEEVRDQLYARMRGARDEPGRAPAAGPAGAADGAGASLRLASSDVQQLTAALREAIDELRGVRRLLTKDGP